MNLFYPRFSRAGLVATMRISVVGAIVAGCYGAVHDQVSYTISPEYFSKFKFQQFADANLGWPPQAFAAEVGFLGTWWVGLIAGWFLARAGLVDMPAEDRWKHTARAFAVVLATTLVAGLAGALLGAAMNRGGNHQEWAELEAAGITDARGFLVVAYLHIAGYIGAVAGVVLAILYVRRSAARSNG